MVISITMKRRKTNLPDGTDCRNVYSCFYRRYTFKAKCRMVTPYCKEYWYIIFRYLLLWEPSCLMAVTIKNCMDSNRIICISIPLGMLLGQYFNPEYQIYILAIVSGIFLHISSVIIFEGNKTTNWIWKKLH